MENFKPSVRENSKLQFIIGQSFLPIVVLGWFYPLIGLSILLCMILGMLISIRRGRKWCDYACPRGSFLDSVMSKISPQKKLPQWFYSYKFRLGFITLLFSFLTFNIVKAWPNPEMIGFAFMKTITITTILSIIGAVFYRARTWCIVCPVGTFSGLIGGKNNALRIDSDKCISCTGCATVCPMGLTPYKDKKTGVLESKDCLKCGTCVANCPTKALYFDNKD